MSKVNCITINTDASFSHQYKKGGYAFWIVCDVFKIQKSGMFKTNPKSALEAEMMCMANALYMLATQKELPETKIIVINSDALLAFDRVGLKKQGLGKVVAKYLKQVRVRTFCNKYEFRHVKAHNGTPDARSFVNNWCDKEAKKWMRLAVKNIQK